MNWKAASVLGLLIFLCGALSGVALYRYAITPSVIVTPTPQGTTVAVNAPALTPTIITQYAKDPKEAVKLAAALAQVQSLTETLATHNTTGGGPITYVNVPVPGTTQVVHEAHFADFRLTFDMTQGVAEPKATYSLHQAFESQLALGKDTKGRPAAAVNFFEIGPGTTRTPLTNVTTTFIVAAPNATTWRLGFNVQAGVSASLTALNQPLQPAALVGLQWLRRGRSSVAEDNTLSLLTPLLLLAPSTHEVGLLPVSLNLGRLPHQPFKDLWLSPLITAHHVGVALTATF